MKMFMAEHSREDPVHTSDTSASLLQELRAFLNAVVLPGREMIQEDLRNLNILSSRQDTEISDNSFQTREPGNKRRKSI